VHGILWQKSTTSLKILVSLKILAQVSLSLSLSLCVKCTYMHAQTLKQRLLLSAVLKVLEKDNYVDWSVRVKTYLMAHDLWDIIEATTEPPRKEDEFAFKAWSKKNSKALHIIQISCGPDTFSRIIEIPSAKIAWDTLAEKYNVPGLYLSLSLSTVQMLKHSKYIIRLREKSKSVFMFCCDFNFDN
jgi:hypothetical protein